MATKDHAVLALQRALTRTKQELVYEQVLVQLKQISIEHLTEKVEYLQTTIAFLQTTSHEQA